MAPLDPANIIASRLRSQVKGLRLQVLTTKELLDLILSYLDPASVKTAALVSRYVKLYRNHLQKLIKYEFLQALERHNSLRLREVLEVGRAAC